MKFLKFLLTFIYPKTCMGCNTLLNYAMNVLKILSLTLEIVVSPVTDLQIMQANVAYAKAKNCILKEDIVSTHIVVLLETLS